MSFLTVAEQRLRDLQSLPMPSTHGARAERMTQLVGAVMTCQTARYEAALAYSGEFAGMPSADLEMAHAIQC